MGTTIYEGYSESLSSTDIDNFEGTAFMYDDSMSLSKLNSMFSLLDTNDRRFSSYKYRF